LSISPQEFEFLSRYVRDRSAIVLSPDQDYLVEARLGPLLIELGFAAMTDLVAALRARPSSALGTRVVEAMTTNETSFFRDLSPFEALRTTILPELIARRPTGPIHIWSAACSSGQEPYSIAMMLREHFPSEVVNRIHILATDLASHVLEKARSGRFSQLEVNRGLPAKLLVRYFQASGLEWHLKDEIRHMVTFQALNLIEHWPAMPRTDIVLIRNVLIYFDMDVRRTILSRIKDNLGEDGYLFLGGSESMVSIDLGFKRHEQGRAVFYRLPGRGNP
jgi:chemotaxis protein methyltransferase CheR